LSAWADTLDLPSDETAFLNFLAGHDGIGILPVKNILSAEDLDELIAHVKANGGYVSYKSNEDGTKGPYELNINYLDALSDPEHPITDIQIIADRFLATQSIMLSMRGVPGIYFHSLFGSQNWGEGVKNTERYRTINREKLELTQLQAELEEPNSLRSKIYLGFNRLLSVRKQFLAFHPRSRQKILHLHPKVFSLIRTPQDGQQQMLCLHHVGSQALDMIIDTHQLPIRNVSSLTNVLTGKTILVIENQVKLQLNPYEVLWLSV
jgi:sucrose phosphorylase